MRTIQNITIIVLAGIVVYFLFFQPKLLPVNLSEFEMMKLNNENDSLKTENYSLMEQGKIKDSTISRFKGDSLKITQRYESRLKALRKLPYDSVVIVSHQYIDTTLNKEETTKEIAKIGFKLDECNSITERQSLQITRLNSRICDLKIIISNSEQRFKTLETIIARHEEAEKDYRKQLRKTKWLAGGVVVAMVALVFVLN